MGHTVETLLLDDAFVSQLNHTENYEEMDALFRRHGVEMEREKLEQAFFSATTPARLSEKELEAVAGGTVPRRASK